METISSKNMLKSVMNGLSTQSTATTGQKIMLFDTDGTPIGKMQAPTDQQGTAIVFDENSQATATTPPSPARIPFWWAAVWVCPPCIIWQRSCSPRARM